MASYIICLTAGGGVPLYISKHSAAKSLSFPIVGSLNGVHLFGKSHDVTALSCLTNNGRIVWREYESVILIVIASRCSTDYHLYQLLDTVYRAMMLFVGVQDIVYMKNLEHLKRNLRCCSGVIDRLRASHLEVDCDIPLVGDIVQAADCILCHEAAYLNTVLDVFVQSAYSTYGCLFANGRVVAATRDWFTLDGVSLAVLMFYIQSSSKVTCRDLPLFLPNSEAPCRLVVIQLINNVNVCLLCDAEPTLTQLMKEVRRFWKDAFESLKSVLDNEKRCFPASIQVDQNVLGFILVNTVEKKCLCSVYPHGDENEDKQISANQRYQLLRNYYAKTYANLFKPKSVQENGSVAVNHWLETTISHQCLETYSCTPEYKFYASQNANYQIFMLFNSKIPTYCLRRTCEKVLDTLTKSKHLRI